MLLSTFLQLSLLSCKDRVQCKVRLDPNKARDKLVTISQIHVRSFPLFATGQLISQRVYLSFNGLFGLAMRNLIK